MSECQLQCVGVSLTSYAYTIFEMRKCTLLRCLCAIVPTDSRFSRASVIIGDQNVTWIVRSVEVHIDLRLCDFSALPPPGKAEELNGLVGRCNSTSAESSWMRQLEFFSRSFR